MLLKEQYPELALEFDGNKNLTLRLDDITTGSNRRVFWLCNNGHSWVAVVQSRIKNGFARKCPYCSGVRASREQNFAITYPHLILVWDFEKNKQLPEKFTTKSNKVVFWKCELGHRWEKSIKQTVLQNGKCLICQEKKSVSKSYNLENKYPELMKFWDYENNLNPPSTFTPFSSKVVYWKCVNGHNYQQNIVNKTRSKYGCPHCKVKGSRNEVRLFCELKSIGIEVYLRHKINGIEFDIYLPQLKFAIEYDGAYYHRNRVDADKKKNLAAEKLHLRLFRIREHPLVLFGLDDILITGKILKKTQVNDIFIKILQGVVPEIELVDYCDQLEFQNELQYFEELKYLIQPKEEDAITNTHPKVADEWDYEKNHPLTPDQFSYGSEKKVWWRCSKMHSWNAAIDKRTGSKRDNPQNCLICSNAIPHPEYNLLTEITGVSDLWDYSKNKQTPNSYLPTSNKVVYWMCSKGHKYRASIVSRVNRATNKIRECIFCNGSVASKENNLVLFCPDVINFWDYEKNVNSNPEDFLPSSNKIVWWKCSTGHSFQFRIDVKINSKNKQVRTCRKCTENMWDTENNLGMQFPFLLEEWDYDLNEIDPFFITPYSNKQVNWKCKYGHAFQRAPYQRINRKSKIMVECPICKAFKKID